MNIALSINFTGTPDADDQRAARHLIRLENERLAQLDPPGTPLPTSTGAELKSSYLTVLGAVLTSAHFSYIDQSRSLQNRFTPEQIKTIHTNLVTRLNAGENAEAIVTDTAS
jgi:hypothetical protein